MANEITKLDGDGYLKAKLLFLYDLTTARTYTGDSGTITIVPTPSAGLPDIAANILTAAEKAALDAGTWAFEIVTMDVPDTLSNLDLLVNARTKYALAKTAFIERLDRIYNRTGQRFNEV